jgi:hypothetical protein
MAQIPHPNAVPQRYTGAWLRSQDFERDPQFRVEPTPDPQHMVPGAGDPPNPSWKAPTYQESSADMTSPEVVGLEAFDIPAAVPVIDQTPIVHTDGGPFSAFNTPWELQRAHQVDKGADLKESYYPAHYMFFNEHYYTATSQGAPPPAITQGAGDKVLRRGLNAYTENLGESGRDRAGRSDAELRASYPYDGFRFRPGEYFQTNVNRNFSPPRRAHDYRWVRPNVVTHIGDAPPPIRPDQYSSPFSSLQRFKKDLKSKPMIRRVPAPFDEDLVHDGSDAPMQATVGMTGW